MSSDATLLGMVHGVASRYKSSLKLFTQQVRGSSGDGDIQSQLISSLDPIFNLDKELSELVKKSTRVEIFGFYQVSS